MRPKVKKKYHMKATPLIRLTENGILDKINDLQVFFPISTGVECWCGKLKCSWVGHSESNQTKWWDIKDGPGEVGEWVVFTADNCVNRLLTKLKGERQ